jgi:4-hydroxybenzoyl-CoA thioesterase
MLMVVARRQVLVEWGHCDPAGIVFNPRFFEWFDGASSGIFAEIGVPVGELVRRYGIIGIPLVETRARFLRPARVGDVLTIESRIPRLKRSSFEVEHRLFNGGELAVEGYETRVWAGRDPADPKRMRGEPVPAEIVRLLGLLPAERGAS